MYRNWQIKDADCQVSSWTAKQTLQTKYGANTIGCTLKEEQALGLLVT